MNLQAQRDLSISGDVVGRDKITINLTRGLDELPTRYDGRVQNFLEYYLGTQEHPAPFGGRASDLAGLDAWLNDLSAPRYAALVAPAGRGKSALLAHWITHLLSRSTTNDQQPTTNDESIHVVYFPISIRFNTNLETVAFASLAARMAHIYGEKVTQATDAQQYRGVFCDYLRRTPPNNSRVLVVLDGLDEAAGWEAGADLFPTVAPDHLRVLVAARPLALDKDETAWLNRLGWETPNRGQRLSLAGLDREGVRDVLTQMGNPLDALATRIDLISRLYDLSEGDPLLVRLYVEALLPYGEQAAVFDPEDLATLQPGLKNYFDLWFEQQQKLWDKLGKPIPEAAVFGILHLCATALGPLKKDEALMLAPNELQNSWTLEKAVRAVNRFIIGEGDKSGYVFSHPRLAEYFAAKLTNRERQAWQTRFLQYGRDTLTALENKTLLPKNAPAYAVQYYGAHLAQANAPATDFYALVCESWLRAWEWLEGTPAGFLNDAERAWQKAEAEGAAALGQQIRAALCFASVISLSANISKDLLVACVNAGVISPALGLVMARQKLESEERIQCLSAIAKFQPVSDFYTVWREALLTVGEIWYRKEILEELTPQVPESLLGEVLSLACTISAEWSRADVLVILAERLPESLLGEALSAARAISNEEARARVLGELALRLEEHERAEVLRDALSAARVISDEKSRAQVLVKLAPRVLESEQAVVLWEAWLAACAISDKESRAQVLGELAMRLVGHKQAEVLREAFRAARAISVEESRIRVLSELAPRLPEPGQTKVFVEALTVARAISDKWSRDKTLSALAPRLSESLLREALAVARTISFDSYRAEFLEKLVPRLPESLLKEALSVAHTISYPVYLASVLEKLVSRLQGHDQIEVFDKVLSTIREIYHEAERVQLLKKLAPRLPESLLGVALTIARGISAEDYRVEVLGELALHLSECQKKEVLEEALTVARVIPYKGPQAYVLKELAQRFHEREQLELLREALSVVRAISDEAYRALVLAEIALRLSEHEQVEVLEETFSTVRAISDETSRAFVLGELALRLPKSEQMDAFGKALAETRSISNKVSRASFLMTFKPRLSESLYEMLNGARARCHEDRSIALLSYLATRWPAVCRSTQRSEFEELSATLRVFARTKRPQLLQAIQALLPVIAEQGGEQALRETARAIVDTANWWP